MSFENKKEGWGYEEYTQAGNRASQEEKGEVKDVMRNLVIDEKEHHLRISLNILSLR